MEGYVRDRLQLQQAGEHGDLGVILCGILAVEEAVAPAGDRPALGQIVDLLFIPLVHGIQIHGAGRSGGLGIRKAERLEGEAVIVVFLRLPADREAVIDGAHDPIKVFVGPLGFRAEPVHGLGGAVITDLCIDKAVFQNRHVLGGGEKIRSGQKAGIEFQTEQVQNGGQDVLGAAVVLHLDGFHAALPDGTEAVVFPERVFRGLRAGKAGVVVFEQAVGIMIGG